MWKLLLLLSVPTVSSGPTCPEGSIYQSNFKSCYKIVQEPLPYSDAEKECVKHGGHLATIMGEEENIFVTAQSSTPTNDLYFWIGNPSTGFSKWATRQSTQNGCTALTPCAGLWAKVDCIFRAPYICKINPFNCPDCPTCPALHSYCDSTWTYFEKTNSCYKGFFKANWNQAEEKCKSFGSHLTSIHSDAENDFIYDLVTMGFNGKYDANEMTWFGLHRISPGSDKFAYTDGTKFDPAEFKKWAPGEPNNKNENCVQLMSDPCSVTDAKGKKVDYTKLWNDLDCETILRRFVCKKPAKKG